ncbi:nitrogen fixation protein NifQ [Malonomonas rubra]|uniref:nitrogen fixation protein NifQ n=1 Tax=Malonomonas rubra TaxID=57040 RepID=UPI0026F23510|nr:nitrogen fixation protein NifQ [Malonomonas rubra]
MQGYTEKILKYASDESHVGLLENPDGTGEVGLSGKDRGKRLAVRFTLKLNKEIVDVIRFQVFGCGYTIAACAVAAELGEGHSLQDISRFTPELIEARLGGLPKERDYCVKLATQALQAAISSARNGANPVAAELSAQQDEDSGPKVNRHDPFYRALLDTDTPPGIFYEDRQMFAGLLTLAQQENSSFAAALGLKVTDIDKIFAIYFPNFDPYQVRKGLVNSKSSPPEINQEILDILLSHVSHDQSGKRAHISELVAKVIAARTAQPGHLWVSMGFLERPQLTAAIHRHLPTLAIANDKGMRWKRYLFKQVCDLNGGVMCKSPNCGECSDYLLCFAPEDE